MAAPSGIVWGSTVGGYGRIGIYVSKTTANDKVSGTIEIWFWSKYSVSDTSNTLYYDNLSSSGSASTSRGAVSISTSVESGSGWSTSNQKKLKSYTYSYTRGTSATTRYLYASLKDVDRVGGTMYASTTISVPALPSYTISYNANGGSGAPGNQTKYYGKSLTLLPTKPTRSGYTFVGWGTSASDTSKDYDPGDVYTANSGKTLYAIWSKKITLTYNVNGGSGSIASQTATVYNAAVSHKFTLSSTKPTKTGHSFLGWSTSDAATTASYSAGGTVTLSASDTLYAVWKANTYTITYNANSGSGAPGSQTKTYGKTLVLSTTVPKRTNYNFLGWATTASATTPQYNTGGNYTANQAATLYAVWELAYVKPTIFNMSVSRCNDDWEPSDDGTSGAVSFEWKTTYNITTATLSWASLTGGSETINLLLDGSISGLIGGEENVYFGIGQLTPESTYTVSVTIGDSDGEFTATKVLPGLKLPLDAIRGDDGEVGVAFGGPAEQTGLADFKMDAKFNKPVYGNVAGLNWLPSIPEGASLDDYIETGAWAIYKNDIAATIYAKGRSGNGTLMADISASSPARDVPFARAGRLEVYSSTGEGILDSGYSYLTQKFTPYQAAYGVWERRITRSGDNTWTYDDWIMTSCTTSWYPLTIASGFAMYGSDSNNQPMYRVNGNLVTIKGVVTPSGAALAKDATSNIVSKGIWTIFRPKSNQVFVCQGSSINRWTLTVTKDGSVTVSRYGTTAYIDIPEGAWLPFNVTYSI